MERRYQLFHANHARNITDFNRKVRDGKPLKGQRETLATQAAGGVQQELPFDAEYTEGVLPYVVVILDELADLMMTVQHEVETPLATLAQKARAVGIHLILATQRPSVNVITGLIKANFSCRIAFRVASKVDSRTILDQNGAETLLGNGDMLFLPPGKSEPLRVQGAFISTEETERLMDWYKAHARSAVTAAGASIDEKVAALEEAEKAGEDGRGTGEEGTPGERDSLFRQAAEVCIQNQLGSTPLQQRRRAELILDAHLGRLAEQGVPLARRALFPRPSTVFSRFFRLLERRHLLVDARARGGHGTAGVGFVPVHQALGLLRGDERALHAQRLALTGRQEQHVAVAEQRFRPVLVEDRAAVHFGRHAERDPAGEVRLDEAGDHVDGGALRRQYQVDPDRAGLLRQRGEGRFDFALHRQHQVRELVHDQHDVRHDPARVLAVQRQLFLDSGLRSQGLARPLERLFVIDLLVEVDDVARVVRVQQPVAPLHLPHRPFEHARGLVVVGHHRQTEVRQFLVHRKLDHLRVDHQQLQPLGWVRVDEARNDRVDAHRLPGARDAGDQEVWHLGEVRDHRLALEILAQTQRQGAVRSLVIGALDQLTHVHHAGDRIGHFDSDRSEEH